MIYVDADHTWKFDTPSQLTAPNNVTEVVGFNGLVAMDFTEPMATNDSLSSIATTSVADIVGNTEPTISASAISSDKRKVELTLATASATADTYTVSVKVVTVCGETIVRKGRLVLG